MYKHKKLDQSERLMIEVELNLKYPLQTIAEHLGRSTSTISREIKKYRTKTPGSRPYDNDCKYVECCFKVHLCGNEECMMYCVSCVKDCRTMCPDYIGIGCKRPEKPPYVCNTCGERRRCIDTKYYYSSRKAQSASEAIRSESHQGMLMDKESFGVLDDLLTKYARKQPITHILEANKNLVSISKTTVYRYIDKGYTKIDILALYRKVKYKKRTKAKKEAAPDQAYKKGRNYLDFKKFMLDHEDSEVVEMDIVKGTKVAGKVLLTMIFRRNSVMLLFLMPDCKQNSVIECLDYLEDGLGLETFKRLFGIILTDNGSEFKDAGRIETDLEGQMRTRVFYCDPMASWQKPHIEKNHEYIRYVLPKGTSLSPYTQNDITLLMNHINSTSRVSLGHNSPYQMIPDKDKDMEALMRFLKMEEIPMKYVNLSPSLLEEN